jgi:hypothetical protein
VIIVDRCVARTPQSLWVESPQLGALGIAYPQTVIPACFKRESCAREGATLAR